MVKYNIISTGSDGNATILEDFVLVDCGVPYKALEPYRRCENYEPSYHYMIPPTCKIDGCSICRPPQSWCYVEDAECTS